MQQYADNTTPLRVSSLQRRTQRLYIGLVLFQIFALISLTAVIEFGIYRQKLNLAESLTSSVTNYFMTKNYRSLVENLASGATGNFTKVTLFDQSVEKEISVLEDPSDLFSMSLSLPIGAGDMQTEATRPSPPTTTSKIKFTYNAFELFWEIFAFWILILALSVLMLKKQKSKIESEHSSELKSQHAEVALNISRQVAHDIRSPLSALNMVIGSLNNIPEESKQLLDNISQRINEIAQDVLDKNKTKSENSHPQMQPNAPAAAKSSPKEKTQVQSVIEALVAEKKAEHQHLPNIIIKSDCRGAESASPTIDAKEFKRLVSNLMNNAIEALPNQTGSVIVSVRKYTDKIQIVISDTGRGIPQSVISQVGEKGFSYGKENTKSGSGLGVFHAKNVIEQAGGHFTISSLENEGTNVEIILPAN